MATTTIAPMPPPPPPGQVPPPPPIIIKRPPTLPDVANEQQLALVDMVLSTIVVRGCLLFFPLSTAVVCVCCGEWLTFDEGTLGARLRKHSKKGCSIESSLLAAGLSLDNVDKIIANACSNATPPLRVPQDLAPKQQNPRRTLLAEVFGKHSDRATWYERENVPRFALAPAPRECEIAFASFSEVRVESVCSACFRPHCNCAEKPAGGRAKITTNVIHHNDAKNRVAPPLATANAPLQVTLLSAVVGSMRPDALRAFGVDDKVTFDFTQRTSVWRPRADAMERLRRASVVATATATAATPTPTTLPEAATRDLRRRADEARALGTAMGRRAADAARSLVVPLEGSGGTFDLSGPWKDMSPDKRRRLDEESSMFAQAAMALFSERRRNAARGAPRLEAPTPPSHMAGVFRVFGIEASRSVGDSQARLHGCS